VKFQVVGADRETGEDVEIIVDARDEVDAETIASRRNIMVSSVVLVRLRRPDPQPSPPVAREARTVIRRHRRILTVTFACSSLVIVGLAVCFYVATGSDATPSQVVITETPEAHSGTQPPDSLSQPYVVVRDEVVYDTPLRGQIEMDLVIDRSLSRDSLLALLREKYAEAVSRSVFGHREHANSVWIFAFASAEYARASFRQPVATITKPPADEQPSVSFDEEIYRQMLATPEVRHGLAEDVRREIFTEAVRANVRAYDEAEEAIPTDPDRVLAKGDTIVLSSSLVLMAENNARDWFESGARSMQLPAGTRVEVIKLVHLNDDKRWAEVGAYPPGQTTGFAGWLDAWMLGLQHPVLSDQGKYRQRLQEQEDFAVRREAEMLREILRRYDVSSDVLQAIKCEGHEKKWPY